MPEDTKVMTFVSNQGGINIRLCTKLYKMSTVWRRRNTVTDSAKSLERFIALLHK